MRRFQETIISSGMRMGESLLFPIRKRIVPIGTIRNIFRQAAVELYYDDENITVPPQASKIEDLVKSDLYTKAGFWVLADIDFPFLSSKTVRINVTLQEYKLSLIDKAAKARGLSRSAFLAECAEHAV